MTFNYYDNVFNNRIPTYSKSQVQVKPEINKKTAKSKKAGCTALGAVLGLALPVKDFCSQLKRQEILPYQYSSAAKMMPDVDVFENTKKNISELLTSTGLKDKGVELLVYDSTPKSTNTIKLSLDKELKGPRKLVQRLKDNALVDIINGENAAYMTKSKKIIINQNILYDSAYHEVGHALNSHSFVGKMIAKSRILTPLGISVVAPIALAVGLLHKVDDKTPKENKSTKEKTLDFVKKNAGLLTLASYIPMLADEGMASIRGLHLAKKYLKPDQLSKLKGNYMKAWGTYALAAGLVSLGVALGIEVADGLKKKIS